METNKKEKKIRKIIIKICITLGVSFVFIKMPSFVASKWSYYEMKNKKY